MRTLSFKCKNKKIKGNVSLLVILILLASSVIALLSINQIQHLLTYGNMTFNYFRSFYLAKAWTELWLTEVYYREAWFDNSIESWDTIVVWNLLPEYTWFNPYFTMEIKSTFNPITNDIREGCNENNKIHLEAWDWIMLSLFRDNSAQLWTKWIISDTIQVEALPDNYVTSIEISDINDNDALFTFWIFSFSGEPNGNDFSMTNISVENLKHASYLKTFLSNHLPTNAKRRYLTIKNSWNKPVEFCIKNTSSSNKWIPYSDSLINVRANYWDMEVWLQTIVKKDTPAWSLNVLDKNPSQ